MSSPTNNKPSSIIEPEADPGDTASWIDVNDIANLGQIADFDTNNPGPLSQTQTQSLSQTQCLLNLEVIKCEDDVSDDINVDSNNCWKTNQSWTHIRVHPNPNVNDSVKTVQNVPIHLIFVVDVSGSMNTTVEAVAADGSRESNGFTILDLVKHSLLTIVNSLGDSSAPPTFLTLISFTDTAKVHFKALNTDASKLNRDKAIAEINGLRPLNTTNLWAGMKEAYDVVRDIQTFVTNGDGELFISGGSGSVTVPVLNNNNSLRLINSDTTNNNITPVSTSYQSLNHPSSLQRLSYYTNAVRSARQEILLFTDGCPNINPPRGHIATMKRYVEKELLKSSSDDDGVNNMSSLNLNLRLSTYGFGYNLDSKLLEEIAITGGGSYNFIPDASFVGTIFIHSCASILSGVNQISDMRLEIEGLEIEDDEKNNGNRSGRKEKHRILGFGPENPLKLKGMVNSDEIDATVLKKDTNIYEVLLGSNIEVGQSRDYLIRGDCRDLKITLKYKDHGRKRLSSESDEYIRVAELNSNNIGNNDTNTRSSLSNGLASSFGSDDASTLNSSTNYTMKFFKLSEVLSENNSLSDSESDINNNDNYRKVSMALSALAQSVRLSMVELLKLINSKTNTGTSNCNKRDEYAKIVNLLGEIAQKCATSGKKSDDNNVDNDVLNDDDDCQDFDDLDKYCSSITTTDDSSKSSSSSQDSSPVGSDQSQKIRIKNAKLAEKKRIEREVKEATAASKIQNRFLNSKLGNLNEKFQNQCIKRRDNSNTTVNESLSLKTNYNSDIHNQMIINLSLHKSLSKLGPLFKNQESLKFLQALSKDLLGEISLALANDKDFNRWGKHYLRSLCCAHANQKRNNFKDYGVLCYNVTTNSNNCFEFQLDRISDVFDRLTPPKPSGNNSYSGRVHTPVTSMSHYNNAYGGCFTGDSLITLADGSRIRMDRLSKGMWVLSGREKKPMKVRCVVKTISEDGKEGVLLSVIRMKKDSSNIDIGITNWHPIYYRKLDNRNSLDQNLPIMNSALATCSTDAESQSEMSESGDSLSSDVIVNTDDKVNKSTNIQIDLDNNENCLNDSEVDQESEENHNKEQWIFPATIAFNSEKWKKEFDSIQEDHTQTIVYNIVLEESIQSQSENNNLNNDIITTSEISEDSESKSDHTVLVGNVVACTLGHGIKSNEVISHPYYGSMQKIVNDLEKLQGWKEGMVELKVGGISGNLKRNRETGLVEKMG